MLNNKKLLVVLTMSAVLLSLPLGGCARKTIKVDKAEETARVADTVNAQPSAKAATGGETTATAKVEPIVGNEGAGSYESLETPPPGQGGMPGESSSAAPEVVTGSRTSVGLLPVFFDFDKSTIRPDQVARIETNAQFLKGNPETKLRIEGNCDSRGTNEYNLALGERRAMGAMKYLVNLGINGSQLSTLSYGEEKPLNPENDETAWAENRRDDFVIVQ